MSFTPGTSLGVYDAGLNDASGQYYAPLFPKGHEGGPTGWRGWITGNEPPAVQADGSLAFTGARVPSGFGLADVNFRFLALDDDAPGFSWRTFRYPQDLPRLRTMEEILSPLDTDLRPFQKAGVDQFDMLAVLESWVEQCEAPRYVVASRVEQGKTVRSRPLCPHPSVPSTRAPAASTTPTASRVGCQPVDDGAPGLRGTHFSLVGRAAAASRCREHVGAAEAAVFDRRPHRSGWHTCRLRDSGSRRRRPGDCGASHGLSRCVRWSGAALTAGVHGYEFVFSPGSACWRASILPGCAAPWCS